MILKKLSLALGSVLLLGVLALPFQAHAIFDFNFELPDLNLPDMTEIFFTDGGYTCPHTWDFDVSADYYYQTDEISFSSGKATTKDAEAAHVSAPTIVAHKGLAYKTLSSFTDTWTSSSTFIGFNVGDVRYQLSPNANDWYYFDGTNWVETTENSLSQANTSDVINANLVKYNSQVGQGTLFFKVFLGTNEVPNLNPWSPTVIAKISLDKVAVNCSQMTTFPDFEFTPFPDFDWGDFFEPASTETCDDGIQNQDETGIDCGGTTCSACSGTICPAAATDLTWSCNNPPYTDANMCLDNGVANFLAAGCSDVVAKCCTLSGSAFNARLTSTECQMPSGTDCPTGYTIKSTSFGNVCTKNTAVTATCSDGVKNQNETAVDCGGVCSACPAAEDDDEDEDAEDSAFVDVPSSNPHAEAIEYLKEHDIVSGYDATHFGPKIALKRAELLKIALNGAGIDTDSYKHADNPFSDLADDYSLKQYVLYAYHNDIAKGYGGGKFGPTNTTTSAEAAKMLLNISEIEPSDAPAGIRYGLPSGSDLIGYIHEALELNVLYDPDNFVAGSAILRDYTAEIMYRLLMIKNGGLSAYVE